MYVFDAVLMFAVMVIMSIWHPGTIKARLSDIYKGGAPASRRDVESPFEGERMHMNVVQK